jgi:vacuolar-type H+-ATPase subunit I/STV1
VGSALDIGHINIAGKGNRMDLERYYLDLFEMLNSACKKIAAGKYEKSDADRLFEFAKEGRYPSLLAELAESFGMMLVKIEAREFELAQIIEELEKAKAKLEDYSQGLEEHLKECCPEE